MNISRNLKKITLDSLVEAFSKNIDTDEEGFESVEAFIAKSIIGIAAEEVVEDPEIYSVLAKIEEMCFLTHKSIMIDNMRAIKGNSLISSIEITEKHLLTLQDGLLSLKC